MSKSTRGRQTLKEDIKQFCEMTQAGHFVFIQVLELKHQWADMIAKRLQGLQEFPH